MDTTISPIRLAEVPEQDEIETPIPASQPKKPRPGQVYRRLAEIFEQAAVDPRNTPGDQALLAEKAAQFRPLARIAEDRARARLLN
jgi:hypothetical protein